MTNALYVSNVAANDSDVAGAEESVDLLDVVVGGIGAGKSLYERNHDHNPFNDGFLRDRPYDGPGPCDRPFVDEPGRYR